MILLVLTQMKALIMYLRLYTFASLACQLATS